MKRISILTPLLFALSLTATAHAATARHAPDAPVHNATATIETGKCAPHATGPCLIADAPAAGEDDSVDLASMPKANPNQALDDAATPVPEPQTFAMFAVGLALLGFTARRRQPSIKFDNEPFDK